MKNIGENRPACGDIAVPEQAGIDCGRIDCVYAGKNEKTLSNSNLSVEDL